jgi:hypothetical protein
LIVTKPRNVLAATVAASFLLVFGVCVATDALAAPTKSTENEATFIGFDADAKTISVKITKNGRGPNKKLLKKGQEVTFNVKPEGSVLTRTTVKINGKRAEISELPEGKTILIRWVPEKNQEGKFFARGIDSILSDEELDERYGTE